MDIITAEEARNITANSFRARLMREIKYEAVKGNGWIFNTNVSIEDMEWLRSLGYTINSSPSGANACFIVWEIEK